MKIIQINCFYGQGSTGNLVRAIHHHLQQQGWDSLVLYGRGQTSREAGTRKLCPEWYGKGNNLLSRLRGIPYGGCMISTWKLLRILKEEKPDLVHLHCINGFFVNQYWLIGWLRRQNIPTVLTLHAQFPFTGNCAHAFDCEKWRTGCGSCPRWRQATGSWIGDRTAVSFEKMHRAFLGFGKNLTVVSVSDWLRCRAEQSLILAEMDHRTIYNGVDTKVFQAASREKTGQEPIVFHATPMFSDEANHPKGGWYVLELARRMPSVRFLVAGKYRLQGAVPENVTLLGEITSQEEMARHYSLADVTLLTSARETFSMVCAESLCCGTPVAGFRAGGPEEISLPDYSTFVQPGDMDGLEAVLGRWLAAPRNREAICREAAVRYDLARMQKSYEALYRERLQKNRHG